LSLPSSHTAKLGGTAVQVCGGEKGVLVLVGGKFGVFVMGGGESGVFVLIGGEEGVLVFVTGESGVLEALPRVLVGVTNTRSVPVASI
jgi:hypothetical protein